ncbi:GNAT family N-acetyltransferase [Candidatus Sumerlaeota bacterium]|nr:GNAT family N-acetyltransferase [Candidatus Sumerlaeales bacterium]NLD61233.1 GNAT family N-acetyltransferase [Candidatus Sumerlaeota bacterium]
MNENYEIRVMRDDEREALAALYNNAYRVGMDVGREWAAGADMQSGVACVCDDGRIGSCVRIIPYTIYAGGQTLRMGGIGGVATWCDLQGRGYAGKCMSESLRMMYDQGYAVSALYPFSYRYYGNYGWSLCGEQLIYGPFDQSKVTRFDERRLVRCVTDAERDAAALAAVYNEFAARYNGMATRSADEMVSRVRKNGDVHAGQTYLIEDDGVAIGYFMCEHLKEGWYSHCQITQFACNGTRAWHAMFGFCASMPTNVSKISLFAPLSPSLMPYAVEPVLPVRKASLFMGRVVDIKKAVEGRGYSAAANGMVRVKIEDKYAPWNSGIWTLRFICGVPRAERTDDADVPYDCAMTINEFSQLWYGYLDIRALHSQGLTTQVSEETACFLTTVFCDRIPYLAETF